MAIFYPTWNATSAYATGANVTFNGVIYTAVAAVPVGTTSNPNAIPFENPSWRVTHVVRIQDYYSLIEAVKLELKQVADDQTNRSIPYFIQKAELSFQRTVRVPQMQRRALITSDSQGRLRVPSDILEPINLRLNNNSTYKAENISIKYVGSDYEEWVERSFGDLEETIIDFTAELNRLDPVFRIEGSYIYVNPTPEANTEYELIYYGAFPQLGTVANLVNDNGEAINANNQTIAQWIAADPANNTATNFVQATEAVTTNYYTQAAPDLILSGALVQASLWLKETELGQVWLNAFEAAKAEIEDQVESFESASPQEINLMNGNYQT